MSGINRRKMQNEFEVLLGLKKKKSDKRNKFMTSL